MAPKSRGSRNDDLKQEDILQAVVFADSFNTRFMPITIKKPRVLLPVANGTLLDYTLEFLCSGGVQETFIFCCHHADQVKEHLRTSRWMESGSPMNVQTITADTCYSMGDALRDIDAKNLIRSDFILMYGDVVSNIKLQSIVEEHKKRRETDKSAVMTMVLRQSPPGHKTRCLEEDVILAIDNTTKNVIHYQKVQGQEEVEFPVEVLANHKDIQIRYDLIDSNISVCSSQVPQLFTDNFDYQTRDDFVRGILINEEIMGNTIQISAVTDAYCARISNLYMYDAVSRDVVNRWSFPFVPDNCSRNNKDSLSYGRHNVYLSRDVTLARGCTLEENVVVGGGTCIGDDSFVSHSVIGRNCKIGKNVTIKDSYLWNNVVIEDNCTIEQSLLCDNVTVYNSVKVCPYCLLSWNVTVGPSAEVKQGTTVVSEQVDDFGDVVDAPLDASSLPEFGCESKAYLYIAGDDFEDVKPEDLYKYMWGLRLTSAPSSDNISLPGAQAGGSIITQSILQDDTKLFHSELLDTLKRAKEENISVENLILEINSLKHAYNISIKDLTVMLFKALLEQPLLGNPSCTVPQAAKVLQDHVQKHLPLVRNYVKNAESQLHCLQAIEEFGCNSSQQLPLVMKLVHYLYDADVLSEDVIIQWYEREPASKETSQGHWDVRKQVKPFITWLQEADEESSED